LGFDLEGIRLSIQKEKKEKFETKIVLENLKDFELCFRRFFNLNLPSTIERVNLTPHYS